MENIVIGSGPAGRLASVELGKLGKEVLLIEKNHIAGTCLNEGCMVICALTDIAKFIDSNNRFNKYGFIKSKINISYNKIVEKIKETQEVFRNINQIENESYGNEIIYGEAILQGDTVAVNGESFNYENLLIATGARLYIPNIPGSQYGLTNKDILKLDDIPDKLNIIGGGIIACEVANIFSTLGSEVNIFARSIFLKDLEEDIKVYIKTNLIPDVNVYEGVNIVEIGKNKVVYETGEEFEGRPFIATGRIPNSEIAKDILEINSDNSIKVNEMMQTNVNNIYSAGDVTGGISLTPVARMEGITAARNMAGYLNKISYNCIPQTLSLNMDVSFVDRKNNTPKNKIINLETPGLGGPGTFWNGLTGDTGFTRIAMNRGENKIEKITSISPSSVSDVSYLSYLMRINADINDFDKFLEIHPSTDANYKLIKTMWL